MENYVDVIKDKAVMRQLIMTANNLSNTAFSSNGKSASEILEIAQKDILSIGTNNKKQYFKMPDLLMAGMDRYEALNQKAGITGIATGFDALDSVTGGFQGGDLIIIAARPSMGKTALVTSVARNMAIMGHAVGIFSIEMSRGQLTDRFMAGESGVTTVKFRCGDFTKENWKDISDAASRLYEIPIFLDDSSDLNHAELRSRTRSMVVNEGIEIVFIDYLGLMIGEKGFGRVEEISSISRNLKAMAKELSIPVVALSQLNRACESRDDKRPRLSDLRDSGSIEQDADVVMFVYRDFVYHPKAADPAEAEIIIGKHRNGPTGAIKLRWNKYTTRFHNHTN
jgi:replicative DNA helicase